MTYTVYQHWDPLRVMVVGKSYPPETYDYITNEKVRKVFYQIAEETEEDYQKLITLLKKFNVSVIRPDIENVLELNKQHLKNNEMLIPPSFLMQPRDTQIMLGSNFYADNRFLIWDNLISHITEQGSVYKADIPYAAEVKSKINAAIATRVGKDLYIGTHFILEKELQSFNDIQKLLPEYRTHIIDTQGHTDATFCPVVPGLILSIHSEIEYQNTFPNWEVVYLRGEHWHKVMPWIHLKAKNRGKWWVPGQELNDDFTDFVEQWMQHWVGYVEETVFDVNMFMIDRKNVIVNGYNQKAFDAFSRYGITPHICNFRHRYFWDGGLHCITSDIHREGVMEDYFPERG